MKDLGSPVFILRGWARTGSHLCCTTGLLASDKTRFFFPIAVRVLGGPPTGPVPRAGRYVGGSGAWALG